MIILMCGFPGSGKSTLTTKLCAVNPNILRFSGDDIIHMMGQGYDWSVHGKIIPKMERLFVEKTLLAGKIPLLDRTHLTVKSRRKYLDLCEPDLCEAMIFHIDRPEHNEEVTGWRDNNAKRPEKTLVPDKALEDMKGFYVKPELSEGFSRIVVVEDVHTFDCSEFSEIKYVG